MNGTPTPVMDGIEILERRACESIRNLEGDEDLRVRGSIRASFRIPNDVIQNSWWEIHRAIRATYRPVIAASIFRKRFLEGEA